MNESLYRIKNITFSFDGRNNVLKIPDIEFHGNSIQALLGPNGSGKTTLLRLLNGLLPAPKGTVFFCGASISTNLQAVRAQTVFLHQNPFLLSGTVSDNVGYGLSIRKFPKRKIHDSVAEALELVGLPDFENRNVRELSGGEAQRVAIARAVILEPRVLIIDEPTANIDAKSASLLEKLLISLKIKKGVTVIVSSHDLPFSYRVADTVFHMEKGEISPGKENIFKGRIVYKGDSEGFFESGKLKIFCPVHEGDYRTLVLRYDDILISDAPIRTSARNRFTGRIIGVEEAETHYRVSIDAGLIFTAHVTASSVRDFGFRTGVMVHFAFKASAVRLY